MTRKSKADDLPSNRVRCLVCGALLELTPGCQSVDDFFKDHRLCQILLMPSVECKAPGCSATGFGRGTRCAEHGGKVDWK